MGVGVHCGKRNTPGGGCIVGGRSLRRGNILLTVIQSN